MKIVIMEKGKLRFNRLLEWLLYMVGYTLVFILITSNFKSIYIDGNHYFIYSFLIVLFIYFLNKTIKPILVTLTIPITGITLGLFYPFINMFILKLTDWVFLGHFQLDNNYVALLVAVLLSITNLLMEGLVIKPIINRFRKDG